METNSPAGRGQRAGNAIRVDFVENAVWKRLINVMSWVSVGELTKPKNQPKKKLFIVHGEFERVYLKF